MAAAPLISSELHVGYPLRPSVLGPLDLSLKAGRLTCLLGPNGTGKTTLLRTLSGVLPARGGRVAIDGTELCELSARRRAQLLAVVLTDRVTVGMLDVRTLVSLGRQPHTDWRGRLSATDSRVVDDAISAAGVDDLAECNIAELSDGERQRVMLARALAQEPRLLILDEITAFLDLPHRLHVMRLLRDLARRRGISVLVSTHDLDLALRLADEVWLASSRGDFHQGAPEELVLRGDFGRVFTSEALRFDAAQGTFRVDRPSGPRAAVQGDDLTAKWIRRALERLGYQDVDWTGDVDVRIARRANGAEPYQIQQGGRLRDCPDIAGLLEALRQLHGE